MRIWNLMPIPPMTLLRRTMSTNQTGLTLTKTATLTIKVAMTPQNYAAVFLREEKGLRSRNHETKRGIRRNQKINPLILLDAGVLVLGDKEWCLDVVADLHGEPGKMLLVARWRGASLFRM
jgi:hypothetical protein